ncbi:hypothetical protein WJ542_31105 [Paraburkholderia sp. B3]|uniref:hypothetical protein n=1 Tax=Paraburkholderia sp. B3 TaxID=3134791 RepID=UPI003981A9BF
MTTRREVVMRLMALVLLSPIIPACKDGSNEMGFLAKKEIVLNIVLFNYFNRPIFEVLLDGSEIGGAGAYGGGGGVMTGVTIPLGKQTLSWRWADTGDTVAVENGLSLTADQISDDDRYLGVHIYPDNTAELTLSQYLPEATPKGEEIYRENHIDAR